SNLNETAFVGTSIYFALSCVWMVLICRAIFVHPAAAALEYKIIEIEHTAKADPVHFDRDKFSPWAYLLLLLVLPIIGICLFLIIGADVSIFLSPEAFAIVPLATLFICAAGVGFKKIFGAFRTAASKEPRTESDIRQAAGILRRIGLVSIEMGVTGMVIKLIIMLTVLDEPAAIFGQFIMGLVPLLYAMYITGALCFPMINRCKLHLTTLAIDKEREGNDG
ncbi:MAG: hypothetical protein HN368_04420, partial [Spirochaetales bacterium]|nr:hypothetical protein [Spirochaetales bacterium]